MKIPRTLCPGDTGFIGQKLLLVIVVVPVLVLIRILVLIRVLVLVGVLVGVLILIRIIVAACGTIGHYDRCDYVSQQTRTCHQ